MSLPLVSVIIPVYNTEKYIKKCLESIMQQSYDNFEIWLIDDGSSDKSSEICDEYSAKYDFIHTIHKENAGQGVARNVALESCKGEYLAFVDSDDSIEPCYIEKMVNACELNNADMCVCGYVSDSGLRKVPFSPGCRVLDSEKLMESYLTTPDIGGMPWNKLYRKHIFEELRFPPLRANEDAYLMADIIHRAEKTVVIADALYVQYIRAGSTERSGFSERRLCLLTADLHLMEMVNKFYPDLEQSVKAKYARSLKALMQAIVDAGYDKNKELFKELHQKFVDTKKDLTDEQIKKLGFVPYSEKNTAVLFKIYTMKKNTKAMLKKLLLKLKSQMGKGHF